MPSRLARLVLVAVLAACAKPAPAPAPLPEPETKGVRVAPVDPADLPVAPGDCAEALRRALVKPDLAVDRIPSPIVAKPPALRKLPKGALRKDGSAEISVDVLIDTLGKADMKTFTVVKASSKLLVSNVRSVLPKWTFSPAELAGCKVPRVYHFMATAPARRK